MSHIGEPYGGGRTRCANANQSAFREESWNRESARDPKAESRTRITARIVSLRAAHDTLRLRISVLRFFLRFSTCGTDSDDDDAQKCQESTSSKRHGDGLVFLSCSRANLLSLFFVHRRMNASAVLTVYTMFNTSGVWIKIINFLT